MVRHGNTSLQTTYGYNVRSWLQRINTSNLTAVPFRNHRVHGLDWYDYEATNLKVSIKSLFRRIYNSVLNMF